MLTTFTPLLTKFPWKIKFYGTEPFLKFYFVPEADSSVNSNLKQKGNLKVKKG